MTESDTNLENGDRAMGIEEVAVEIKESGTALSGSCQFEAERTKPADQIIITRTEDSETEQGVHLRAKMPSASSTSKSMCLPSDGSEVKIPDASSSEKLCGWLSKLGNRAIVKTYKTRWFVYGDTTCKLYYYRMSQDLLPLGEIDIHNASFAFDVTDVERPGLFEIRANGRLYFLDARDRQTMMYWLQELQKKRREYSQKRTSLSKTRVSLISASQKVTEKGLLAKERSVSNGTTTLHIVDETAALLADVTPQNHLIGENSAAVPPSSTFFTNLSLTNLGTEIRNALSTMSNIKSPVASPVNDFTASYNKSSTDEWAMVNIDTNPSISPTNPQPPTEGSTKSPATNQKFTFLGLRRKLTKRNVDDMGISSPTPVSSLEPCQKCNQFHSYLVSLKEEIRHIENELRASREVTKLLQKETTKLDRQVQASQELHQNTDFKDLLKTRDDKVVDLEYLLTKTQEEKEMTKQQVRDQGNAMETLKDQVTMYKDMLAAKDETIVQLTNQVFELEQGRSSNSGQPGVQHNAPILRVFTDATEVERLKDSCQAYEMQNKFLSREILELNELRRNDEARESLLQMQNANMEAKFYQTRSKYLFLLNELKTPIRGGEEVKSQDVIDQLLADALDTEEQDTSEFYSSQNSTVEYDRYGFLKNARRDEEDVLLTRAVELQRRSDELEIQIKEADENNGVSHQVKWENFMVSQGNKDILRSPELKNLVRGGIPHEYREHIWKACINLHISTQREKLGPYHYKNLVSKSKNSKHNPAAKQVELDLLRTLPTNQYYENVDSEGIRKLRRILLAYSWHNPEVGYCQGLNRIAAIALLFLSEEDAFWCLVAIVESIMPQNYYSRTLMAAQADQRVLKDLLQEKMARLHAHMEQHEVDLSLFTFNWYLTIFVDNIPPETFLRVWDVFLYEGSKVLFRFALAFFKYTEQELLQQDTQISINKYLRVIGEKMTNIRRLTQIAFHELNPFPRRVIASRRHFHLQQVKAELEELDMLREDFRSHNVPTDRREYYSDDDADTDEISDRRKMSSDLP